MDFSPRPVPGVSWLLNSLSAQIIRRPGVRSLASPCSWMTNLLLSRELEPYVQHQPCLVQLLIGLFAGIVLVFVVRIEIEVLAER